MGGDRGHTAVCNGGFLVPNLPESEQRRAEGEQERRALGYLDQFAEHSLQRRVEALRAADILRVHGHRQHAEFVLYVDVGGHVCGGACVSAHAFLHLLPSQSQTDVLQLLYCGLC